MTSPFFASLCPLVPFSPHNLFLAFLLDVSYCSCLLDTLLSSQDLYFMVIFNMPHLYKSIYTLKTKTGWTFKWVSPCLVIELWRSVWQILPGLEVSLSLSKLLNMWMWCGRRQENAQNSSPGYFYLRDFMKLLSSDAHWLPNLSGHMVKDLQSFTGGVIIAGGSIRF